jgi:hypothetical protein
VRASLRRLAMNACPAPVSRAASSCCQGCAGRRRTRAAVEPCESFVVAIRKQRVCGLPINCLYRRCVEREQPGPCQPYDRHERGRSAAEKPAAPDLRAIDFDRCDGLACPSLRAHFEPNPARRPVHPDLAGSCIVRDPGDAVNTFESLLLWSGISPQPQEGKTLAILPPDIWTGVPIPGKTLAGPAF